MKVTVRLGRRFAQQAGFADRDFDLPEGATAEALLGAVGQAAPALDCVEAGRVDLAAANLSVNGKPVDPRSPGAVALRVGDACYLFAPVAGG